MDITNKIPALTQGDDFDFKLSLFAESDINYATPLDLRGCKAYLTIKKKIGDADDATTTIKKDVAVSSDEPSPVYEIDLSLTHTQMNIPLGSYILDCQVKLANGQIFTPYKQEHVSIAWQATDRIN
jgi:hypothetical protein